MASFQVTLTVTDGPHQGDVFTFAEHDTFLIGRSPEAHFSLPDDPYFSRLHLLIEVNPPLCRLMDLQSHNGTRLNGRSVRAADLTNGDEIRAGRTLMRVSIGKLASKQASTLSHGEAEKGSQNATTPPTFRASEKSSQNATAPPTFRASAPPPGGSHHEAPLIPGYSIVSKLGAGGMGIVWLARKEGTGANVAIKTIRPAAVADTVTVQRFLREAAVLRKLDHLNIVRYQGEGEVNGVLYFIMDYVDGADAARLVKEAGPLPIARAVDLVRQMLEGLAYAHHLGFVHRDIKPANLLVTQVRGKDVAKLADFGLARAYQASTLSGLTLTGAVGGTPAYMAPEQIRDFRNVTPAADQYSAAATLYTLLTGRAVHDGTRSTEELFKRILLEDAPGVEQFRPEVPARLAQALRRALAKDAKERFRDVTFFMREMFAASGHFMP